MSHGSKPVGLARYLVGPGRENEHQNPHLVAGDDRVMLGYGGRELSVRGDANPLGHAIDYARALHEAGPSDGRTVWHCSLSLGADEGSLSDEQWQQVSNRFMELMDFTGDDVQAPVRWAAIRHGLSTGGNDHVHLVASRVRDDGTLASWHNDFPRSQESARQVEHEFGLRQLGTGGQGMPGYSQTEARRASEQQQPGRTQLEPTVRAAAESAGTEAEFVQNLRGQGLLVHPRYATGSTSEVVGYSVASRPTQASREAGQTQPVWFGGGRLARDLTLPKLRARWDETSEQRQAAVGEWRREPDTQQPIQAKDVLSREDWTSLDREIGALNTWIGNLRADDADGWRHAAGQVAGGFASLARRFEHGGTGPVSETARALSRCAQTPRGQSQSAPQAAPRLRATNTLLLQAGSGRNNMAGWMAVMRQLERTSQAVTRARALQSDAGQAQQRADTAVARVAGHREQRETALGITGTKTRGPSKYDTSTVAPRYPGQSGGPRHGPRR